jgi:hypothetical protein
MNIIYEFIRLRDRVVREYLVDVDKLSETLENEGVRDPLAQYFSKFFDVEKEKKDDSNKYRFDIILFHPSDYDKKYPLIIECKKDGRKRGKDIGLWCNQCKIYSDLTYKGNKIHVFCYPQISQYYLFEGTFLSPHEPWEYVGNINSFLYASFGIGEVLKIKKRQFEYVLCINNKLVWRSESPENINYNKL